MKTTVRLLLLILLMSLFHGVTEAQPYDEQIFIDLTRPQEAELWNVTSHDTSQGPAGYQDGKFVIATAKGQAPAFMERTLNIDSSRFDRAIIDMKVISDNNETGMVSSMFFFSQTPMVNPDSRIAKMVQVNARTSVVFELSQSVFWSGNIGMIRIDPVWGHGKAEIYSITIDKQPEPDPTPEWYFNRPKSDLGWMFGEFGVNDPGFKAREIIRSQDGITFTVDGPNPVLQSFDIDINAELANTAKLTVMLSQPFASEANFYWSTPDKLGASEERKLSVPLQPTIQPQIATFDLKSHPEWNGNVNFLLMNPTRTPGTVTVQSLVFEGVEGLGERGQNDALVLWRTHQEVGQELKDGNYKPLLVLVTRRNNSFSKQVELELAGNDEFLHLAKNFHSVKLDYDDPAAHRVFKNILRVPILAMMRYDFGTKNWEVVERIEGPDVRIDSVARMKSALGGGT